MHREGTTLITDQELLHLHASPFLTKFQVQARFAQGIPATTFPHIPLHSTGAIPLSLDGFWDTLNTHQWNSSLLWLERDFDPTRFLTRKPNTVAPQGTARTSFLNCLKAGTNLLIQFQSTHPDGTLQQNNRYNQMTMLLRCAPILLLQQGSFHKQNFTNIVNRRCTQFLRGEWHHLFETAIEQNDLQNEIQEQQSPQKRKKTSDTKKYTQVLQQARNLNYSRAMNLLRSPGLSTDSPEKNYEQLKELHPNDSAPLQQQDPAFAVPMSAFDFITGKLIGRLIRRAKRGTAVDQWGWDSREMWRDILTDAPFLDIVAKHWILPVAAGYLPTPYQQHLAGGRLVALSKQPKPGIRPINITDSWRRIAAKTLLTTCLPDFNKFFQQGHPRVFQFSTATPDGAATMFHILNALFHGNSAPCANLDDLLILLTLDIKNAFNTHSRQRIYDFFSKSCSSTGQNEKTWSGWDILWKHFAAHYGTTGLLKFYHSGKTYTIPSVTGTQQGDPLGGILFTAPLQPLFNQIADTFPDILICVFADNTVLLGPQAQALAAADLFNTLLAAANLALNPIESNILVTNLPSTLPVPTTMTTQNGLEFPCTTEGLKLLGTPLGTAMFCQEQFNKIVHKIEQDHALLKDFPYWHQRVKLLTFNVNTRINYSLRTTAPFITEQATLQLDQSVDNFLADTLHFPANFRSSQEALHYERAIQQLRLGIRDGGSGCFRNAPLVAAASYSALAVTINWLHKHPIAFNWQQQPLLQTLVSFENPNIISLQQWNLPVATISPSPEIRDKQSLPLQIPSPSVISDWPAHLFPTQGDFGRHIKKQLVAQFTRHLTVPQQQRFHSIARHTLQLSSSSHLMSDDRPVSNLWQCSTSLFSLTCFYELSNQAFLTTSALLLDIPIPHALFLQTTQPNHTNTDKWADELLNKSAHASDSRHTTHAIFAQELTKIANNSGVLTTCVESRLPYRDAGIDNPTRKRADMMTLTGCGVTPNAQRNFSTDTRLIMDVTIGHVFDTHHNFKPNTLQNMANSKCLKYATHYQRQRLAFAPIVANTLGQFGADTLQVLWNLADHQAQNAFGFTIDSPANVALSQCSPPSTQQENDYRRLRGLKYHENRLRLLTCVFEGVTTRIIGQTFNLTCSPDYHRWLETTRHNWLPILPPFDVCSQDPSSSQDSNPSQNDPTQYNPSSQPTPSDMSISPNDSPALTDNSNSRHVSRQQPQVHANNVHASNSIRRERSPRSSRSRSPTDCRPSQRSRYTYADSVSSNFSPHTDTTINPRAPPSPPHVTYPPPPPPP